MTTEREKMMAGALYCAADPELQLARARSQVLLRLLNATPNEDAGGDGAVPRPDGSKTRPHTAAPNEDAGTRFRLLKELFGDIGEGTQLNSPFACDYGSNIRIGRNGLVNYNCVFLDCNLITIGDSAQNAPGVQIYTAHHPLDPEQRRSGLELASPVAIGNNVWLGGGAIVCPGVTIGDDSVIGAGSVVTHDIPASVLAVGNPCRVVKSLRG